MSTLLPVAYCLFYSLHQNIAQCSSACKRHNFRPTLRELPVTAVIVADMHMVTTPLVVSTCKHHVKTIICNCAADDLLLLHKNVQFCIS